MAKLVKGAVGKAPPPHYIEEYANFFVKSENGLCVILHNNTKLICLAKRYYMYNQRLVGPVRSVLLLKILNITTINNDVS